MRTTLVRAALVTLVLIAGAASAAAQAATEHAQDLLTPKEVRELVANATTPEDHARLSRHYTALADKYEASAAHHRALAAEYRKRPRASETKRPGAPDTSIHCVRLAERDAAAAKEARALAAAHERSTSVR